ncbi:CPBP family glutamic-type intramembrane protease [Brachybacterium paraconglomeratum]|uniref:CPBP family glutamic-type intramembrane protease n=1 Tax=Brachybacterium paraconglomeratum TaxID=173362 RepID=UPI0024901A7C|nr:CPBP family glutamic-type intramembrane protease [Brachybacterium paraconglomeratum]
MSPDPPAPRPGAWWVAGLAVLVAAPLLAASLRAEGGGPGTVAGWALGIALTWTVGGLLIMRLAPSDLAGRAPGRAPRVAVAAAGVGLAAASLAGGLVLAGVPATAPWVAGPVAAAADGRWGVLAVALVAGAAEEVFFRGALPRLLTGSARWVVPTAVYALVTLCTGSPALAVMALLLGPVAMWARETSGSLAGALFVHALWTLTMVGLFPAVVVRVGIAG